MPITGSGLSTCGQLDTNLQCGVPLQHPHYGIKWTLPNKQPSFNENNRSGERSKPPIESPTVCKVASHPLGKTILDVGAMPASLAPCELQYTKMPEDAGPDSQTSQDQGPAGWAATGSCLKLCKRILYHLGRVAYYGACPGKHSPGPQEGTLLHFYQLVVGSQWADSVAWYLTMKQLNNEVPTSEGQALQQQIAQDLCPPLRPRWMPM